MSVKIRMKRVGTKNTPVFRIVVADSRSPRDGKCIEEIGTDTELDIALHRIATARWAVRCRACDNQIP